MRRNILLGLIALCGYIGLSAQEYEYIPFVRDCEFGYYSYSWGNIDSFSHYCIKGDTIFNDKKYKGFYYYTHKENTELIGYVREENKKVYLLDKDKEWLWYDFTLQVNDSVKVDKSSPFANWSAEGTDVFQIDTLEFAGKSRKYIYLRNANNCWVEGIGDIGALPLSIVDWTPTCPCGNSMFYLKENGQFIFRDTIHWIGDVPINDPFLDDTGIDKIETTLLLITQHPGLWIVTLPSEGYRMVEVIDTTGKIAWCEYIDSNANSVTIPTENLARGIYIVALTSQSGVRITRKITL